jgi:hypothetical protein
MKECVFTICANNFLAQALTLRDSFKKYNSVDFYIFLADRSADQLKIEIENLIVLDYSIIPKWEEMAFKYTVQEFICSLKPFCAFYLFNIYDKVIYFDADIYVTSSLDIIFNWLNDKSFVITPHCIHLSSECNMIAQDEEYLRSGIYNMGFFAIRKSENGIKMINWWMKKLEDKCYNDLHKSLFVDQHWIDFLPAAFPDEILITHHQGCNMAIWNLLERQLLIDNNKYLVQDIVTNDIKKLLFFHFSGFNPDDKNIIDQKRPEYTIEIFPFIVSLINEYADLLRINGYEKHSKKIYEFNYFFNGDKISNINRRIYGILIKNTNIQDPFSDDGILYKQFKKKKMISKSKNKLVNNMIKKKESIKIFHALLKISFYILKIDKYQSFLNALKIVSDSDNQIFLYRDDE